MFGNRRVPRSRTNVVARLRPLVRTGGGPVPAPGARPGYAVQIWRTGRDALFAVARGDDDCPVLTCGLGVDDPARMWERLLILAPVTVMLRTDRGAMPATTPWLAVVIQDFSVGEDDLEWLADFERCLAWTLIAAGTA